MNFHSQGRPKLNNGRPTIIGPEGQNTMAALSGLDIEPQEDGTWLVSGYWIYGTTYSAKYYSKTVKETVDLIPLFERFRRWPEEVMQEMGWTWSAAKQQQGGASVSLEELGLI